jgi:hypothetical protein
MAIAHMIRPAAKEDFALSCNPLYSGSAILMLLMECSTAGLDLANHHLSIFAVAHVYNDVRQLKLLEQSCPIMDRIIELHRRAIFADVVPSTLEDIKARMKYRVGHSKDRGDKTQPQYFMQIPKLSETLSLLLDSDDTDQARALLEMEGHMNDTARHGGVSSGTPDLGQTAKGQTNLRRTLEDALEDISLDYTTLTNQCHRLLGDMRKYWGLELRLRDRPSAFEDVSTRAGDHFDWIHIEMCIRAICHAANIPHREHLLPHDPYRFGTGLKVVANLLNNLIAKETDSYALPLGVLSPETRIYHETYSLTHRIPTYKRATLLSTASDLQDVITINTYVVIYFHLETDGHWWDLLEDLNYYAQMHTDPGILAFARASADIMPDESKKYCNWDGKQTFVVFERGKQIEVDGSMHVRTARRLVKAIRKVVEMAEAELGQG